MSHHRSRLCHFVIDCDDLDRAVAFWSAALDATEEPLSEQSRDVYRQLRLPDSEIRVLLQRTDDVKVSKERMHLDLETDDVEAGVKRLEALGATRWDHQQERSHDFWVLHDPWATSSASCSRSSPSCSPGAAPGAPSVALGGDPDLRSKRLDCGAHRSHRSIDYLGPAGKRATVLDPA